MSLGNTVLQLFCCYYSWCLYRYFQCWVYCTFTLVLSEACVQCPIWLFSVVPWLHGFLVCYIIIIIIIITLWQIQEMIGSPTVCRRQLTAEAWVPSQANPCWICGGWTGSSTGFTSSTWVLTCQYHTTNAPYSIYLLLQNLIILATVIFKIRKTN